LQNGHNWYQLDELVNAHMTQFQYFRAVLGGYIYILSINADF